MSDEPVPYVSRHRASIPRWIEHLKESMPDERVVPFDTLDEVERSRVRVAVVADPDPADLASLPALEWVQSTWAGVERLIEDLPPALHVSRLTDPRLADTMSEAVLTAVLWLHRNGPTYARQQDKREWRERPTVRPERRTVGVLGLGKLGSDAAMRLAANNFRTLGWSRTKHDLPGVTTYHGRAGFVATIAASEIVVVLLPLTVETRGLIDGRIVGAMRPGTSIVNFGRGPIIDDAALLSALDGGRVAHAFLDVFATEPLPADHPFWAHERVTIWPHVSAPTDVESASAIVGEAIRHWRETGERPPAVDRQRGY